MDRDMDVIRKIVLATKEAKRVDISAIEGIDNETFCLNALLLIEAGLVKGRVLASGDSAIPEVVDIFRLTWEGCDFADSIVDPGLWDKAKEHVIKPGVSWTFTILCTYLKALAAEKLGIQ